MNEIKLTKQLVDRVIATLCEHEPVCEDRLVATQYLTAVIGYMLASQSISDSDGQELLGELSAFLHHVYDDLRAPQQQAAPSQADPEQAFGIWKPE